jgi:hypothetical protein
MVLEEKRPGGGQGVLVQGMDGLHAIGEARGEVGVSRVRGSGPA